MPQRGREAPLALEGPRRRPVRVRSARALAFVCEAGRAWREAWACIGAGHWGRPLGQAMRGNASRTLVGSKTFVNSKTLVGSKTRRPSDRSWHWKRFTAQLFKAVYRSWHWKRFTAQSLKAVYRSVAQSGLTAQTLKRASGPPLLGLQRLFRSFRIKLGVAVAAHGVAVAVAGATPGAARSRWRRGRR